ncbi:MAG: T9SS type A sorting domain-containing protein [Bacteroidia bacterium]|nr:T9SS type A sorting domain-containing protein [Bacteroidia bacterium]
MYKKVVITILIFVSTISYVICQSQPICILDLTTKNTETSQGNLFSAKHLLKSAGFSFTVSDSVNLAIQSKIILSSSNIESYSFNQAERDSLKNFVLNGGIWIATNNKDTSLNSCFGITKTNFNTQRFYLNFKPDFDSTIFQLFNEPYELQIRFGDTSEYNNCIGTRSYTVSTADTLALYETGEVAITHHTFGLGHNYLLGTQFKEIILRPQVKEDYGANREFSNGFDPAQDVYMFLLSGIIKKHLNYIVYKHTAYCNFNSTLVITHDVDATTSMELFDDYASYEKANQISSTYLITTHYVHDKLAQNFFDGYEDDILKVYNMGHNIQSHSVSHMPDFDNELIVPMGSPGNTRYTYTPYFNGTQSTNTTVFGEAEVSRDLLSNIIGQPIKAFRSGYLAIPDYLFNVLDSLKYEMSSCHSANDVMSNVPFFAHTNLDMYGKETQVLEIPNTISDVFRDDPISETNYFNKVQIWKSSFDKNHQNNLSTVLLIHPNRYFKLYAEQLLIQSLPENCFITNLEQYGDFWKNRDSTNIKTRILNDTLFINLSLKAENINEHLSFIVNNGRDFQKIFIYDKDSTLLNYVQSNWNTNDIIIHRNCYRPNYSTYTINETPSTNEVYIHPNPSEKNEAWLHFNLMEEAEVSMSIFDTKGSLVSEPYKQIEFNLGSYDLILPYQQLNKGIYLIKLQINSEVYHLKWILIE